MSFGRTDEFAHLNDDAHRLLRDAHTAVPVTAVSGTDQTGVVTATLSGQGSVVEVRVAAGWRQRLSGDDLATAVVDAVRDASLRRIDAWARIYGEDEHDKTHRCAGGDDAGTATRAVLDHIGFDPGDIQRRLHTAANGQMSEADRLVALTGLLEVVEAIEQGIDEVSGRMQAVLVAPHTGHSPHREVAAVVTGAGELTEVRIDTSWVRQAHEANIGRQITTAIHAAHEIAARHGLDKLIADSSLGRARRAMQDPAGLARRLGLTS